VTACDPCLRRSDLIARLGGWLDVEWKRREVKSEILAVPDDALLGLADQPAVWAAYEVFDADAAREEAAAAGLAVVCRCQTDYPDALRELPDPPAALFIRGTLRPAPDAVGIVGARRASDYGIEVARMLGRSLTTAGVPVVSGLAIGVDAAAHEGAMQAYGRAGPDAAGATGLGRPIAVLAAGADVAYPRSKRRLYDQIAETGAVISELPPRSQIFRWAFPARNRIIAALSQATIVVEAAERSGSLITADLAIDIGRAVGAVPGRITAPMAAGSNALLAAGAAVIRGLQDVLDLLADHGFAHALEPGPALPAEPHLRRLLESIGDGRATIADLVRAPEEVGPTLEGLTELETRGLVRRGFGGRYTRAL
jgi:DNA processing protein